ncbi:hypothetical protein E1295_20640 [Nonomuraea mesophila]|uniref:Polysaccharide biosynthesis protein n=1 Tax=Nonomuraea mesophila TaxID=2530382 RepID=A0A4R5FFV0_9ACTN|nr:hypothetical protein [Nonomuraea mesophila]TDE49029.1 hypothetical protein E1295_20640 [Nonomuraea mesophila]
MTTTEHRIGPRRLLTLLGGRATFRLLLYGSAGVLVAAWSREDFNRYAAAVGAVGWLCMVVQSGPEKAALTLIPRAGRTRRQIAGMLRAMVTYVPLPFTAAAAAALLLAPDATITIYLLAIAYYIGLGCGMLGVAVHRALGSYTRDTVHFTLLGLGMIGMAGLAFTVPIPPSVYLAGLLVLVSGLNLALLRGLPRAGSWRRPVRDLLARTVVLMGAADVMSNAMIGTLFVELSLTSYAGQSGDLYMMTLGWGFAVSVVYTLQRIYQPRLVLRMGSDDATGIRLLVRRAALLSTWAGALWLALAGAALAGGLAGTGSLVALGVLLASLLPVNTLASAGMFVLENSGRAGLRDSARAVVLAWAATTALGALVVPLAGAAGAVYALGAQGFVLGLVLRRRM